MEVKEFVGPLYREVNLYGPGDALRVRARASARCFIYVPVAIFAVRSGCRREFCSRLEDVEISR